MPTRLSRAATLFCVLLTLSGCSITHVMRVQNRQVIGVDIMIGELRAPVVLVGENHEEAAHHKLQLKVVKQLQARGEQVAIGMEMFEASSQQTLDAWSAGKVPEESFRKVFQLSWRNIPWELYEDILLFARDNKIPIVALNAPRGVVQKVAKFGVASLTTNDIGDLPPGLDLTISDAYLQFIQSAYSSHGRSGDDFRNICEAQMIRNRVMARRIGDYVLLHPERTMVVLAGGGHARERGGIPAELGELRHRVILPNMPGLDRRNVTRGDADYLLEEPSWLERLF